MALSVRGWGWLYRATSVPSHLCAGGLKLSASRYPPPRRPNAASCKSMAAPECAAMTTGNCSEVNKSCRKLIGDVWTYWRESNAGYEALMNISVI